jgi:hypothetical protein
MKVLLTKSVDRMNGERKNNAKGVSSAFGCLHDSPYKTGEFAPRSLTGIQQQCVERIDRVVHEKVEAWGLCVCMLLLCRES